MPSIFSLKNVNRQKGKLLRDTGTGQIAKGLSPKFGDIRESPYICSRTNVEIMMEKEGFVTHKMFAGEKKASMHRRCADHDYTARRMYMITMTTEGRQPLFGAVVGKSEAPAESPDAPHVVLTELGERVKEEWWACSLYHPEIEVIALQMMPDHLHGVLFVKEKMDTHLGMALRGFKQSCNKHYRQLFGAPVAAPAVAAPSVAAPSVAAPSVAAPSVAAPAVGYAALPTQQTQPPAPLRTRSNAYRQHGLLFAPGYNDKLLLRGGQLDTWLNYLRDNPRRLLMKREHPDLFRVQRGLVVAGISFSAIGNRFLLDRPVRLQVQCSRRLSEDEIAQRVAYFLKAAREGAVLVSPSISKGEKRVMRAAFDEGLPLILLQENGFTDLAKPGGKSMEACAAGQLLIMAPWEHHNENVPIQRGQCLQLNDMARKICEG